MEPSTNALEAPSTPVDNNSAPADSPSSWETIPMLDRPADVPEKFFKDGHLNVRDILKSYTELEKSRTQSAPAPAPTDSPAPAPAPGESPAPVQGEAPLLVPGVQPDSMSRFTSEVQKDGKLSEASYTELAKAGYPKAIVDAYVKGLTSEAAIAQAVDQVRVADQEISAITESVGGKESLSEMLTWATHNLGDADLKAYNDAVTSADVSRVRMAVRGLHTAYREASGPNLMSGRGTSQFSNLEPFVSSDSVVTAMEDPRYDRDPNYREEVQRRIAISNVFGQSREFKQKSDF